MLVHAPTHMPRSHYHGKPMAGNATFKPVLLALYAAASFLLFKDPTGSTDGGAVIPSRPDTRQISRAPDLRLLDRIKQPEDILAAYAEFQASGLGLSEYVNKTYGIRCGDDYAFEACLNRHIALLYGHCYYHNHHHHHHHQGGPRPCPIPDCTAIGIPLVQGRRLGSEDGEIGGSQSTVRVIDIDGTPYLAKVYKQSDEGQYKRKNDAGPFQRELSALRTLSLHQHHNAAPFLQPVCFWESERAILFPFCPAGDLVATSRDVADIVPLVDAAAVFPRIARQLITAVHAMHAAGICHLDIKPENLLIRGGRDRAARRSFFTDRAGDGAGLVLIDWGLCVRTDELAKMGCVKAGTKVTMSPEQLLCHRPLSAASDWWGVGATLWRIRVMWDPVLSEDEKEELLAARDRIWQHPVIDTKIGEFGRAFGEMIEMMLQLYPEYRRFDQDIDQLLKCRYLQDTR